MIVGCYNIFMLNRAREQSQQTSPEQPTLLRPAFTALPERIPGLSEQLVADRPEIGGVTWHSPEATLRQLRKLSDRLAVQVTTPSSATTDRR